MLKQESQEIGGIKFDTRQLPAMRAFKLLTRLLKVVGPALGALSGLDPSTSLDSAGPALAGALAKLDPDEASSLVLQILAGTKAWIMDTNGLKGVDLMTQDSIDLVFGGKLKTMLQVIVFVCRCNFSDFFPENPSSGGLSPAPSAA